LGIDEFNSEIDTLIKKVLILEFQIATLISPITGSVTGEKPQSFGDYDTVVAEIASLDGISKVELNWDRIAAVCGDLLTHHTKDLKVASFLAFAWFKKHDFEGLAAGFQLLDSFVNCEYAADVYPRRKKKQEKARAAAFLWLATKVDKHFQVHQINSVEQLDNAEEAIQSFAKLNESLKLYLNDEAPAFSELRSTFKRFQASIYEDKDEKAKEKNIEESVAEREQQPKSSVMEAKPAPVTELPTASSPSDINKVLIKASAAIKSVAVQIRSSDLYSANAFYLNRVAKWMLIQELPPSGILERQPNELSIKKMQLLEASNDYAELLNLAELEFNNGALFCLSLHRYVHLALVALDRQSCADVVFHTTLNFVTRFPNIIDVTFKNGEPFVNELTKAWLNASLEDKSIKSVSDEANGSPEHTPWLSVKVKAEKLFTSGKSQEALSLFQEGILSANSFREKVLWRYEMAVLLSKIGHDEMVVMQLQHTQSMLNENTISVWQPELSINVLKLMLACHKRLQLKIKYEPNRLEEVNKLKRELALLSPSEALAFVEPQI